MNSLDAKYRRIKKADNTLTCAMADLCQDIQEVTDFDIVVQDLAGDGWCVMSEITGFPLNMRVEDVIDIIKNKGKLTLDDWNPFN